MGYVAREPWMSRWRRPGLATAALLAGFSLSVSISVSVAYSAPGAFDPAFGVGGLTVNQFSSAVSPASISADVAAAPGGKIVAAGQINDSAGHPEVGVARYLPNGQLDTSFGAGGAFVFQPGLGASPSSYALYSALAVMPDGRIVLAGTATDSEGRQGAFVARLTASGALDPTFAGGYVAEQLSDKAAPTPFSEFLGLALQPDGKVVVTGERTDAAGKNEFIAERFNTNGSLDGSFATGGVFVQQLGTGSGSSPSTPDSLGTDVILEPNGELVFSAQASDSSTSYAFAVLKLTSGGQPDLGFGSGGLTVYQPSAFPSAQTIPVRVVRQSSGKLVLGGAASFTGEHPAFALARFTAAGALDPTFGTGGATLTQLSSAATPLSEGIGLVVQANDRLVLPGLVVVDAKSDSIFTVARYTPDGALDPTFATNGVFQSQLGSGSTPNSDAVGAAISPDGQLLVSGAEGTSSSTAAWLVGRITLEEPSMPIEQPAGHVPPSVSPLGAAPGPPFSFAGVTLASSALTMDAHGNITLSLSSAVTTSGTATLTGRSASTASTAAKRKRRKKVKSIPLRLGGSAFTLLAGQMGEVKVHLSKSAQALVRASGRLGATVTLSATAGGQSKTTSAPVTIKASKAPIHHKAKRRR
jgi:uncharacterized delta-60 repeat protein